MEKTKEQKELKRYHSDDEEIGNNKKFIEENNEHLNLGVYSQNEINRNSYNYSDNSKEIKLDDPIEKYDDNNSCTEFSNKVEKTINKEVEIIEQNHFKMDESEDKINQKEDNEVKSEYNEEKIQDSEKSNLFSDEEIKVESLHSVEDIRNLSVKVDDSDIRKSEELSENNETIEDNNYEDEIENKNIEDGDSEIEKNDEVEDKEIEYIDFENEEDDDDENIESCDEEKLIEEKNKEKDEESYESCSTCSSDHEPEDIDTVKMQILVSNFSEDQLNRYTIYRRSTFPKAAVKRLMQGISGVNVPHNLVIAMAGIAKVMAAQVIENALDVQEEWKEGGTPITPHHIREGLRRVRANKKIYSTKFQGRLF